MDNKELEMLHVIDDLWQTLKNEPLGRITAHGIENPDGYRFVRIAEEFANKVKQFCAQFSPSYYEPYRAGIYSTLHDEVQRVQRAQEAIHGSRISRAQQNDLVAKMNNVISIFNGDFYEIFDKIQELKDTGKWEIIESK